MGENTLILENLPQHLYRAGKWLPTLSWSRFLDDPFRLAMAASAGKIRQLEYCLQTLCSVERSGCLWKPVWPFQFWPRLGVFVDWFDDCSRPRLFSRSAKKDGEQSLGRSRGGHSTKIHLATDALGNAIRFILTGGQRNDITQAEALLENLFPDYVLADKGYDSDKFVLLLKKQNSEVVIPSRVNRKIQREIDLELYKERHLIECCIGKLKHFRRVFSRFAKLAKNYLSFVQFAGTIVWLRWNVNRT